jgi:hypothetical protein
VNCYRLGCAGVSVFQVSYSAIATQLAMAEILATYTPQLIMDFRAYGVQAIADKCLHEKLITEDTHKRVLDPQSVQDERESNIKKSTILLRALQTCVERDASCFESLLNVLKLLDSQNAELVSEIKEEYYFKLAMSPASKRRKNVESQADCTMETKPNELFIDAHVPEIKAIQIFITQLVGAISTCNVVEVVGQFLAKELITDGVYKRILEARSEPNDSKIRMLLIVIMDAIHVDNSSFRKAMNILKEFPLCSEQVKAIENEYQKFISQGNPLNGNIDRDRPRSTHLTVCPEIRVIQKYTPELISAICTCLPEVSDECLRGGLITVSKYRQLVDTNVGGDKATMLLQAIKDTIAADKRCFEIFLDTLSMKMPPGLSRSLISSIKEEHKELVSMSSAVLDPMSVMQQKPESDNSLKQNVLDKLDEAIKKGVLADMEVKRLEKELALKEEENNKLKEELKAAETAEGNNSKKISQLKKKIIDCKAQIDEIDNKLNEQKEIIEEYEMNVKREITVAIEKYKKETDALRAATEAEKEKVQQQKDEKLSMIEAHIEDKMSMIEMHKREIDDLKAYLKRGCNSP